MPGFLRTGCVALTVLVVGGLAASCSHAWDDYDPRLVGANDAGVGGGSTTRGTTVASSTAESVASSGAGGSGASTATATTSTSASSGGGDGGGGVDPIVHCEGLPKLGGAPTIDGELEPGLFLEAVAPVGWRLCQFCQGPLPAGHAMSYAAAWRDDGLYFFVEVTDPDRNPATAGDELWRGDAVEIYVDHDGAFLSPPGSFDTPGTLQFIVAAPGADSGSVARAARHRPAGEIGPWSSPDFIAVPTAGGYRVEALVSATDLGLGAWSLVAGDTVGIDLSHDVSLPPGPPASDGNRLGQYFLQIGPPPIDFDDYPFRNAQVFCAPQLLAP